MLNKLLNLFLPLDEKEARQKINGEFIEDLDDGTDLFQLSNFRLSNDNIFDNHPIIVRKHRRFAPYPLHNHDFLEINFMFQGESKQIVNGQELILREKQVLLMDTDACHSLEPLGYNDILLNIIFNKSDLNISLLKNLDAQSHGLAYTFFVNSVHGNSCHENYLVLDIQEEPAIQNTLEQMVLEFFKQNSSIASKEIMDAQSQILFYQLSRVYHSNISQILSSSTDNDLILAILQKIESDYTSITLTDLATFLGYNSNYLSNLIKKKVGKTFSQLVREKKLKQAHLLIETTSFSIETIAEMVGYTNKRDFYIKFKDYYHKLPSAFRK
ncbi:helix-turn-helix domain-containing protein [Pseudolactococcus yaeyamensis]